MKGPTVPNEPNEPNGATAISEPADAEAPVVAAVADKKGIHPVRRYPKIPSACATCHTFPQVGSNASSFPLGMQLDTHMDRLNVFNHTSAVKSLNPAGTTCAGCHARSYCENCHKSGAVRVKHDTMLYSHASSITAAGGTKSCIYCHLPVYCATCHKETVLESDEPPLALNAKPASSPTVIKARPAS